MSDENYGDDRFILIDVETFGLDPDTDPIIEVGFRIVDRHFQLIDEKSWLVWNSPIYDGRLEAMEYNAKCAANLAGDDITKKQITPRQKADLFVLTMHTNNKLLRNAQAEGLAPVEVEDSIVHWLNGYGIREGREPLVGSSLGALDVPMLKAQMPRVIDQFHYRTIDISSVKELCRRLNSSVYSKMDGVTLNRKIHRVLPDMEDSVSELKFYVDNFLWVELADLEV